MTSPRFYFGKVSHQRYGAISHKLTYRIAYILVDLDHLKPANKASKLLGIGASGLLSFRPRDHGDGESDDLAGWARRKLVEQGCEAEAASITLLTLPRMFGFVFNPLSVFFIKDSAGELHHVLYEVGNTFGERHFYLCEAGAAGGPVQHVCDKAFYVSPFFDVSGTYTFKVLPPEKTMSVHIRYDDENGAKSLTASMAGQAQSVTNWTCLKLLLSFPFMTLGVVAGIHWEALKLWIKGARYRGHGTKRKEAKTTRSLDPQRSRANVR